MIADPGLIPSKESNKKLPCDFTSFWDPILIKTLRAGGGGYLGTIRPLEAL